MKITHIDSSVSGENSVSRRISAEVVQNLVAQHSDATVIRHDLGAQPLAHLTLPDLADHTLVDEFLAADVIVIGAPMYNFTVPTNLKAWLDRIAIAGKTFRYSEDGRPAGAAGGRKVIVASTRGGFYGAGSPLADYDFQDRYLRAFFGFLGITDIEFIHAEGLGIGAEQRERALSDALEQAADVAA